MTDRELLETLLQEIKTVKTQVNKIDNIEQSLQQVHAKLDAITEQVVQNSEELTTLHHSIETVTAQTEKNAELRPFLDNATSKIEALETDMKLVKKIISS